MAYGDGGFFFLQPVGNGYSGVSSLGASSVVAQSALRVDPTSVQVHVLMQRRAALYKKLGKKMRSPFSSKKVISLLRRQIAQAEKQIAMLQRAKTQVVPKGMVKPSTALRAPSGKYTFRQAQPEAATEVMPEPLLSGEMMTVPGEVDIEMLAEGEMLPAADLGSDSYVDRVMGFVQERPLMSALAAGVLGFGGYKLYKRWRG